MLEGKIRKTGKNKCFGKFFTHFWKEKWLRKKILEAKI